MFDAALLAALPQFELTEMVGALLLFRLFYYIVPFALSLTLLGARELSLRFISRTQAPAGPDGSAAAHTGAAIEAGTEPGIQSAAKTAATTAATTATTTTTKSTAKSAAE